MNYKLKRTIKDVLGWDEESRLSRGEWLTRTDSRTPQNTITNLMVSFTTTPSRIDRVHITIESILRQTIRPVRVALWLTARGFTSRSTLHFPGKLLGSFVDDKVQSHGISSVYQSCSKKHKYFCLECDL